MSEQPRAGTRGADAEVAEEREVVLRVRDLEVGFGTKRGRAEVVRGIDYDLHRGETLAIVGESGSGRSVSTLALTKLIPIPPGRVTGSAHLGDTELIGMTEDELIHVRGQRMGFVFQDPMNSLNPVHTIGRQLTEGMRHHLGLSEDAARQRAIELLAKVGIPSPAERLDDYPHRFSGGMRQRVVIAIGLSCDPEVLGADEATTALPAGCGFYPRCSFRDDPRCETERPRLREIAPGHLLRSFYEVPEEVSRGASAAQRIDIEPPDARDEGVA